MIIIINIKPLITYHYQTSNIFNYHCLGNNIFFQIKTHLYIYIMRNLHEKNKPNLLVNTVAGRRHPVLVDQSPSTPVGGGETKE